MALEVEFDAYQRNLPHLLDHEGEFVLIHGAEIVGTFKAYEEAIRTGYEKFGFNSPFFVRQIQAEEKPKFFTRRIRPCEKQPE